MHLVTVIGGEAFEACDAGSDMNRKADHYWIKDDGGPESQSPASDA